MDVETLVTLEKQVAEMRHWIDRKEKESTNVAELQRGLTIAQKELLSIESKIAELSKAYNFDAVTCYPAIITATQKPRIPGLSEAVRKVGIVESTRKVRTPGLSAAILAALESGPKPWLAIFLMFQNDPANQHRTRQGVRTTCVDLVRKGTIFVQSGAGQTAVYALKIESTLPVIALKYPEDLQAILRFFLKHTETRFTAAEAAIAMRKAGSFYSLETLRTGIWELGERKKMLRVEKPLGTKRGGWLYSL